MVIAGSLNGFLLAKELIEHALKTSGTGWGVGGCLSLHQNRGFLCGRQMSAMKLSGNVPNSYSTAGAANS